MRRWRGRTLRDDQLTARGTGRREVRTEPGVPAAATAARAGGRAATPDDRPGCRTAGTGSASRGGSAPRIPDDRSRKNRIRRLRAGPRRAMTRYPDLGSRPPELGRLAAARHSDTGTADTGPGVSPGRWWCVGTADRRACAAIAVPPRGTRGYSSGPGGGSAGTASRTPWADTAAAWADEALDGLPTGGERGGGPRKRRTSDGQASGAGSVALRPEAPCLIRLAFVADPFSLPYGRSARLPTSARATSPKPTGFGLTLTRPKQ